MNRAKWSTSRFMSVFQNTDRWIKPGKAPRGRRRHRNRATGQLFVPKYRQIAADVDRRRKAVEAFNRLASELKVSRGAVLRAYDFANRDAAAAWMAR